MSKITTAVVLASGHGNRLKPLTSKTPKPLVKIGNRYLIEYVLENLYRAEIEKVLITTRPFGKQFPERLGDFYKSIALIYEHLPPNSPPLGAAGDLKTTEHLLPEKKPFLVCSCDIITNLNFRKLAKHHFESEHPATIALVKKESPEYPTAIGLDKKGDISKLHRNIYKESAEKYTFACQHVLNRWLLKYIPKNKPWGFFGDNDLYPTLIKNAIPINTYIYPENAYWEDVGTLEKLEKAKKDLKGKSPLQ